MSFRIPAPHRIVFAALALVAIAGSPALGAIRVTELNLGCLNGSRDVAFIELKPQSAETFDPRVGLEVRGVGNVVLYDIANVYGGRSGSFPVGRAFLLATSAFQTTTGFAPDTLLPAAPSFEEGRITLYRLAADNVTRQVLDQFTYGPTVAFEPPPPGWSLVWDGTTRVLSDRPTPETYLQGALLAPCFGTGTPPSQSATWRFGELLTACGNGSTLTQFVELECTRAGAARTTATLSVFDHTGVRAGTLSNLFGVPSAFLGAFSLEATATLTPRDALLSVALDPVGGRVELWQGTYLHDVLRWGTAAVPAPPAGMSIERQGAGWIVQAQPTPNTRDYVLAQPQDPLCFGDAFVGLELKEVFFRCVDGQTTSQFVEIGADSSESRYNANIALDVLDATGVLRQRIPVDFGQRVGQFWSPGGPPWLVGEQPFQGNLGPVAPDTPTPLDLDLAGGRVRLVKRYSPDSVLVLDSLIYGAAGELLPPDGHSLVRNGPYFWDRRPPSPRNNAGEFGYSDCLDLCPASTLSLGGATWRFHGMESGYLEDSTGRARMEHGGGYPLAAASRTWPGVTRAEWKDELVVEGPAPGTDVELYVTASVDLAGPERNCSYWPCIDGTASVELRHSNGQLVSDQAGEYETRISTIGLAFRARAGEPFEISAVAVASITDSGGPAPTPHSMWSSAGARLHFYSFAPGVSLISCKTGASVLGSTLDAPPPAVTNPRVGLSVRGVYPNPTAGPMRVAFVLPATGAVRVELIDVAGRRVLDRDLGTLGAGDHVRPLAVSGELRPGFYVLRVRQGGESSSTRVLVTR